MKFCEIKSWPTSSESADLVLLFNVFQAQRIGCSTGRFGQDLISVNLQSLVLFKAFLSIAVSCCAIFAACQMMRAAQN